MRLQIYVLNRTLAGVGVALGAVVAVILLVNFVEVSRSLGGRPDVGFLQLFEFSLLKTPAVCLQLLPFVFLFGSMGAFVTLNRRNELVVMRAAGISAWRFTASGVAAAFVIGLVVVGLLNPVAAALNGRFEDRRAALTDSAASGGGGEIWLRQGADGRQTVIHGRSRDRWRGALRLSGVSIFIQKQGPTGVLEFTRRIEADQAVLLPGYWRLSQARDVRPGAESVVADTLILPSPLDRRSAMEKFVPPAAVSTWDLPSTIRSADLAGYSSTAYQLRLQQLFALPLLLAAMTLLAASFSLRLLRLGDLAGLAGAGVGLGFLLFFLNQICGALGVTGALPIALAAWAPPVVALLSAVTLLCYTEDG